ncbi:hypothetical protein, variant 3 [Fonticula alba]|nr:hypothetical protein, variant 3 [Fonticula alba]KCV72938.1 hypothetical protein, variant 3 [Fonticula alba]|eukprot:XP_009492638.1 hypothetical protein, variant 3 [Fonticula alba]
MPPFIVGRVRWDNWLLAQFIGNQNAAAVDATEVVFAVHLNHMKVGGSHSRSGTDYNINLTKSDAVDPKKLGDVESCDYYLAPIPNSPGNALSPKNLPAGESAPSVFTRPGADFSTTSSAPSGACPFCTLRPKEQSIDVMLAKQADPQTRDVIVATVNSGYLDFSINWMCTLLRIGRKNFLFHATDRAMYTILRDRGLPVIYYESNIALEYKALLAQSANGSFIVSADETAADGTPREKAYDYGSVAYQALMNSRTEFIYKILQKGYNVLLSDVDVVFLRDPLQFVDRNLDIQGGAHKVEKITGGFIYFRATDAARALWVKVLLQHRTVFKKIQAMENFNIHSMTEQELVNELLKAAKPDEIKWGTIDEKVVADGKRFFIDKLSQKNGEWPAAIHNNYIIGVDNKRQRFMNISMWLVDDDLRCQAFPGLQAPTPYTLPLAHVTGPPARGSSGMRALASSPAALSPGNGPVPATVKDFRLTVKIIAFNRPRALLRLFRSLDAADFMGDKVDLDIYIDFPSPELVANATLEQNDPNNEADISLQEYARVRQMSEVYRWRHGRKQVHARDKHYGLAGQWLASWFPMGTTEIAIILEDDNIVSPYFYVWLKRAVEYYYFNPEQFDPRVYGIMLQSQHMIPGRYPKRPKEFLPHDAKFFRYQLLSTWGPVFFPHHWAEFISWFNEKSSDPSFQPLFSNMITNSWFLARGGGRAVWSAWFMRFAAERGYYALYTNFPDGQAFVVNYRDKGVNYHKDQGANSPMVEHIMPYMDVLPPMKELPLYDFHFNRIDPEDPSILEDRAIYSDIFNIEIN